MILLFQWLYPPNFCNMSMDLLVQWVENSSASGACTTIPMMNPNRLMMLQLVHVYQSVRPSFITQFKGWYKIWFLFDGSTVLFYLDTLRQPLHGHPVLSCCCMSFVTLESLSELFQGCVCPTTNLSGNFFAKHCAVSGNLPTYLIT